MDFSTPERSLRSILRRAPPLSDDVLATSRSLLPYFTAAVDEETRSPTDCGDAEEKKMKMRMEDAMTLVLSLLNTSPKNGEGDVNGEKNKGRKVTKVRWEPLAVGTYLAMEMLDSFALGLSSTSTNTTADKPSEDAGGAGASGGATHYVDGPRLPDLVVTTTTTSTTAPATPSSPAERINSPTSSSSSSDDVIRLISTTDGGSEAMSKFCQSVLDSALSNMEHDEPRVRTLVARTLGAHARLTSAVVSLTSTSSTSGSDDGGVGGGEEQEQMRKLADDLVRQRCDAGSVVVDCLVRQWRYKREGGTPPPLKTDPNELEGMKMPSPSSPQSSQVNNNDGGEGKILEHGGDGDSPTSSERHVHPLDDTTGWRALETSLHAYASWIDGCGASYWDDCDVDGGGGCMSLTGRTLEELAPLKEGEDQDEDEEDGRARTLLDVLELCCTVHVNRHVRAAGLQALEQLVKSASAAAAAAASTGTTTNGDDDGGEASCPSQLVDGSPLRSTVGRVLKITLADNWSQVRMAASVLCRTLFLAIKDDPSREDLYPTLLPRMCLNRFYLAQGVKLYSQETWRLVLNEDGPVEVARHAAQVCRYYAKMCDADNHVVREAACQAIAELAQKLGTSEEYSPYLAPYVPVLLQALLVCFFDESWPVRDEACLACGTFARAYPDECRPELPVLFERWCEQLTDQIWSVREDAAVALGDAIAAYGDEILDKLLPKIEEMLPGARNQPPMTREELLATHNDAERHTGSQLYSCGSLAPKLGRGSSKARSVGGCSDCKLTRPPAPWEATDGCVYMMRELCRASAAGSSSGTTTNVELGDDRLLPLMRELADVCRVKHFPQADDLRTTLWKQLPDMARALGKQRFKRHYLDLFLDLLASNVEDRSASQLSVYAAEHCCVELAGIVGRGIFLGRAEDYHRAALERCLVGAQGKAGGPGNMKFGGGMPPPQAGAMLPPQPLPGRMPF